MRKTLQVTTPDDTQTSTREPENGDEHARQLAAGRRKCAAKMSAAESRALGRLQTAEPGRARAGARTPCAQSFKKTRNLPENLVSK